MTKDEILEMARQADVWVAGQPLYQTQLEKFAKLIAEKEFKSGFLAGWYESGEGFNSECGCSLKKVLEMCDEAIRARGQE
jgi:hypothetical protein